MPFFYISLVEKGKQNLRRQQKENGGALDFPLANMILQMIWLYSLHLHVRFVGDRKLLKPFFYHAQAKSGTLTINSVLSNINRKYNGI